MPALRFVLCAGLCFPPMGMPLWKVQQKLELEEILL